MKNKTALVNVTFIYKGILGQKKPPAFADGKTVHLPTMTAVQMP